jgi:hypothetical protein
LPDTTLPSVPSALARLSDALATCVRTDPSGAFEVGRDASLVLQLRDGAPVYAEGRNVPGLGARLVARGRISGEAWDEMVAGPGPRLGERLVSQRVVSPGELDDLLRSILVDAMLCFALGPDRGTPQARPASERGDWLGWRATASLAEVLADVARLTDRLAGEGMDADVFLQRSASPGRPVVVTAGQWPVVWRADGRSTVRDICGATGLGLAEILLAGHELVRSGLCTALGAPASAPVATSASPAGYAPESSPSGHEPFVADEPPVHLDTNVHHEAPPIPEQPVHLDPVEDSPTPPGALPRRRRGSSIWNFGGDGPEAAAEVSREKVKRPDMDLVRQILQGLRDL